jgi:hypothetical protein
MRKHARGVLAGASALGLMAVSCGGESVGPGDAPFRQPAFAVQAGGLDSIGCEQGVAWDYSAHFRPTSSATFIDSGSGNPRQQCGDLGFNESTAGAVQLRYRAITGRYERWFRRLRRVDGVPLYELTMLALDSVVIDSLTARDWPAPAQVGYDLTAFAIRHTDTYAETQDTAFDNPDNVTDAYAHLWRHVDPPYVTDTTRLGSNRPKLIWQNRHLGRLLDSTEVYRSDNGAGFERVAALAQSASEFADTALVRGVYGYFVRHVTALGFAYPDVNVNVPLPHSSSSDTRTFYVDTTPPQPPSPPVAPSGLRCEGNFDPEMDCFWFNGDTTASTEIYRNDSLKATLFPRETHYLDLTVVSDVTYQYKIRHVKNGTASSFDSTTAAAQPVPPENLSCGGTSPSTVTCVWIVKEPYDTVQVQRRVTVKWSTVAVLPPTPYPPAEFHDTGLQSGTTYYYRVRYKRGARYSGFSNEDPATPGSIPEPYRPQP